MSSTNGRTNGHMDGENQAQSHPRKRNAVRALIQDFSPLWFVYCMNAGIIAILLHQLPYQFRGLPVLSTIAFMIEFVLFIIFSILFLARLALFGKQAYTEITSDIEDLCYLGFWPISWLTLSALVSLIVSSAGWGGHAFTVVAYVMWWFGAGWMLLTYVFVFVTMIRTQKATGDAGGHLPPLILIPTVGTATVATTGGLIASYSFEISDRLAVPVIIFSFMTAGIAIFTAILLGPLLLYRLFAVGWPEPAKVTAMFINAGPFGQVATALQLLSSAANTYSKFANYSPHSGPFISTMAAQPLYVICVLLALLLEGMGAMFALLAVYAMLERAFQRQLTWTPSWNAIIFPLGTVTTACTELSTAMNSPAFRVVNAGLVIILVIMYLVNAAFTLMNIVKGEMLIVRKDPRMEKDE